MACSATKIISCLIVACVPLVHPARAADVALTPTSPSDGGSLEDAKKKFLSVKEPTLSPQTKTDLARLGAPEFATAPAPTLPKRSVPTLEKSADNWLVDGVMGAKHDEAGKIRGASETLKPDEKSEVTDDNRAKAKAIDHESTSALPVIAPNPLASYMAAWTSAQDRQQLQSMLDPTLTRTMLGGLEPSPTTDASSASSMKKALPTGATSMTAARGNPYLQSQHSELAELTGPFLPEQKNERSPLVTAPTAPQIAPIAGNLAPRPESKPTLARPADEQKYFKQLNRF